MPFEKLKKKWENDRRKRRVEVMGRKMVLREKGIEVFKKYHISKAILFGSVTKRSCDSESDIDLYVHPLDATVYWDFHHDLEEDTGYEIDLYTDSDDKVFIEKIIKRGEAVYEI